MLKPNKKDIPSKGGTSISFGPVSSQRMIDLPHDHLRLSVWIERTEIGGKVGMHDEFHEKESDFWLENGDEGQSGLGYIPRHPGEQNSEDKSDPIGDSEYLDSFLLNIKFGDDSGECKKVIISDRTCFETIGGLPEPSSSNLAIPLLGPRY